MTTDAARHRKVPGRTIYWQETTDPDHADELEWIWVERSKFAQLVKPREEKHTKKCDLHWQKWGQGGKARENSE